MKKALPMSMAALEAAHDTLVTLNAPPGAFGSCLETRLDHTDIRPLADIWIDYFEFMPNLTCVALIVRRSATLLVSSLCDSDWCVKSI
jgi:hypothetical protein